MKPSIDQEPPLVVHIVYALHTGGLENGLVNIINRMPRDKYRHAIIALTDAGDFAQRLEGDDVPVYELHKPPGNSLAVFFRLRKLLKSLNPRLVHTRNLAALEMQLATLFLGVARIHGEHGRDVSDLEGKNPKHNLVRKLIRPLIHRYIAVSADLQQWLTGYLCFPDSQVVQIYNGVDYHRFKPVEGQVSSDEFQRPASFSDDCVVIGSVGRLAAVKNHQLLVSAFAELQHNGFSQLRLMLVGDGPEKQSLQRLAQELGVLEQVWFSGDRSDIPNLLQSMDVFVLPSLGEGVSNTVLEAMAASKPVIASRVGGCPELVDDGVTGLLFQSQDKSDLVSALTRLIQEPELRKKMGIAGRQKIEQRFDWGNTVRAYTDVYDQALG